MTRQHRWENTCGILICLALLAVGMLLALGGCGDSRRGGAKPLVCHVGGTMSPAMERLAALYEQETGRKVEINTAGSGELLAHIEGQKQGDLYVCHDPFVDILMQKYRMGVDGWVVAELTPVIVVAKGNPRGISTVADLARADVSLALTDYERSTLGRMLKTIFTKAGVDFDQMNRDKTIVTHKSGGHVANLVKTGNADAAMVWNAVAHLRRDGLDVVPIPWADLPVPGVDTLTSATGKSYSLTPVRVTIATLTCSAQPERAGDFAEFIASRKAAQVFKEFGFTETRAAMLYRNGTPVEAAPPNPPAGGTLP